MRRSLHLLRLAVAPVALAAAWPAAAQAPTTNVMLPWQQGRAKPPAPRAAVAPKMTPKKDVLPWLAAPETLPWQTPAKGGASIETGAVDVRPKTKNEPTQPAAAGNGLVLKSPLPGVPAPAAATGKPLVQAAATETVSDANDDAAFEAEPVPAPEPGARPSPGKPGSATATVTAKPAAAAPTAPSTPSLAKQPAPTAAVAPALGQAAATAAAPTSAADAAVAAADDVAPIPPPLPEAVVTPVATGAASPAVLNATDVMSNALQSKPAAPKRLPDDANVAQQYCFNIADAAKDARYAWQKKTLADIELELNKRIALLDERTAEYQKWLARRDEFIRQAEEGVVKIYGSMKADAAATQLTLMQEETAAAILTKLGPRPASAILNEMEAAKAAKLTMIITGAAKLKKKKPAAGADAPVAGNAPQQPEAPPSGAQATNGQRS